MAETQATADVRAAAADAAVRAAEDRARRDRSRARQVAGTREIPLHEVPPERKSATAGPKDRLVG